MKFCPTCKQTLPIDDFHRNRSRKDGHTGQCKNCRNAYSNKHYHKNLDEERKRLIDWRIANSNRNREGARRRYKNNVTKMREKAKEKRKRNPDEHKKYEKRYKQKYPERSLAKQIVYMAVRRGDLPPAHGLVCECCQEAQAAQYHHHKGYEDENMLNVMAVCISCHGELHRI